MANDPEAPRADRVKLLQWYVELGIGKPGMIDKIARDNAAGVGVPSGVMLLPIVPDASEEDADDAASLQF